MKMKFQWPIILVIFTLVLYGCTPTVDEPWVDDGGVTAQETSEEEPGMPSVFSQAPMLDELDLPPVEERLPDKPQVLTPYELIGQYGGTWHAVTPEPGMPNIKMIFYDPPVRWKPDYSGYEMGLAESFDFNQDGTQLTLNLRPGLKWSDGQPYTTEDWRFWWEDLAMNEDYPAIQVPRWARNKDGSPFTIDFPDPFTIIMKWDSPQWFTPYILAQGYWEWEPLMKPAHFLKQYHPDYEGSDYVSLREMDQWWETPGYPTIFAWVVDEVTPGVKTVFVRNPYYWKVDTEGQQLPYLDYISVEFQPDEEVRVVYTSQGRYDATFRATTDPLNLAFLQEHAADYGYQIQQGWVNGAGAWPGWVINQDYTGDECGDPFGSVNAEECRALLRNVNFRKGLSAALDRPRILAEVWDGLGYTTQATISPQSMYFSGEEGQAKYTEWAAADAEYDPELATGFFKSAGFVDVDGDGWRDLPSGRPFVLVIDLNTWGGERVRHLADKIALENWKEVGINTVINNVQNQAADVDRANQGLFMIRGAQIAEMDVWTQPEWVFPVQGGSGGARAFPLQSLWYASGGKEGIQPDPGSPVYRLQELYQRGVNEDDQDIRQQIFYEAIDIHIHEGPFLLGAAGDQKMPVVVKNTFHNVSEFGILGSWAVASPGNQHPEQFWSEIND